MYKKTLPLLMAGLLASAGAFAQSSGGASGSSSGDSAMTAQPGSPSQSLQSSGSNPTQPSTGSMGAVPGTAGYSSSSSSSMGASPSTGSTGAMGAAAAPNVVVVQPAVAVPVAVPVYVQRDARSERYTGNRAVDTGSGQLESNMGPYDNTWRNTDRSRDGSY
jgi:hypothetical protein